MDSEAVKMTAIMSIEQELKECKRALKVKAVTDNERLKNAVISMQKDLTDFLDMFNEHNESFNMKGRIRGLKAKGKRKVIEARLVKKAFGIRKKYKKEIAELNEILGD